MNTKTAYVWGPISNFSGYFMSLLLEKGWHLHVASKSALQVSLSPLDLASTAQHNIEKAAGGAEKLKLFRDRLVFLDNDEPLRGTTYDIILFMGLPSNFDEPRASRAPWAAEELARITQRLKDVPVLIVSSLWGGIQPDGAVPEEIEFDRRKPLSHFEGVCQQYEMRVLKAICKSGCKWHLLRLPLILGSSLDGRTVNFSGPYKLFEELQQAKCQLGERNNGRPALELNYNPHATLWMLPCDWAANVALELVEDGSRPVICNIVSTQATLNQEWMHELGEVIGVNIAHTSEKDNLSLPATLRSLLTDNIQVKTRNLFEVLGRHQQAPMVLTRDYFEGILFYALERNWGHPRPAVPETPFSPDKARAFFEEFLPANLDPKMLKTLAGFNGGLAFQIDEQDECRWLLRCADGRAHVQALDTESDRPQVSFRLSAPSFGKLAAGKMMFETALVSRALQVSGGYPIQSLIACDFFRRFLRLHHFNPGVINNLREESHA